MRLTRKGYHSSLQTKSTRTATQARAKGGAMGAWAPALFSQSAPLPKKKKKKKKRGGFFSPTPT